MKALLPLLLLVAVLGSGCSWFKSFRKSSPPPPEPQAAFKPLPEPSAFAGVPEPSTPPAQPAPVVPPPAPAPKPVKQPVKESKPEMKAERAIITPDAGLQGKVATYNEVGRFVVLTFPIGQMPKVGNVLAIYRGNLKVGEAKITGPQRDENIVGDLTNGEATAGDEVRSQ